jgi:hypothetical protein
MTQSRGNVARACATWEPKTRIDSEDWTCQWEHESSKKFAVRRRGSSNSAKPAWPRKFPTHHVIVRSKLFSAAPGPRSDSKLQLQASSSSWLEIPLHSYWLNTNLRLLLQRDLGSPVTRCRYQLHCGLGFAPPAAQLEEVLQRVIWVPSHSRSCPPTAFPLCMVSSNLATNIWRKRLRSLPRLGRVGWRRRVAGASRTDWQHARLEPGILDGPRRWCLLIPGQMRSWDNAVILTMLLQNHQPSGWGKCGAGARWPGSGLRGPSQLGWSAPWRSGTGSSPIAGICSFLYIGC